MSRQRSSARDASACSGTVRKSVPTRIPVASAIVVRGHRPGGALDAPAGRRPEVLTGLDAQDGADELVAAEASDGTPLAHRGGKPSGQGSERRVTLLVRERVAVRPYHRAEHRMTTSPAPPTREER